MLNGRSYNFINMSGFKTGRLTVTDDYEIRKEKCANGTSRVYWKCVCDCGNTCIVFGRNLRVGITKSCGCLRSDLTQERNGRHALPNNQECKNTIFKTYRVNAKNRGIVFALNGDQFEKLISGSCYYCGVEPLSEKKSRSEKIPSFFYNGIDRVDNTRGYESGNCVPCCRICNQAKSSMAEQEFRDWVGRVFNHIKEI